MSSDLRKFMDILARPANEVLTEATDYSGMFNDVRKVLALFNELVDANPEARLGKFTDLADFNMRVAATIKLVKKQLVKDDRVVWFCRYARLGTMMHLRMLMEHNSTVGDEELAAKFRQLASVVDSTVIKTTNTFVSKTSGDHIAVSSTAEMAYKHMFSGTSSILDPLLHFYSLGIEKIDSYQFGFQSLRKLRDVFSEFEDEWKKTRTQSFEHNPDDGEIVMEFPDGMFWELLHKGYCEKEGDAMGHCGNKPSVRSGDRLLSLRQIVKQGGKSYVRPSLTFILNRNDELGEMKGRANEKPAKKYHPHIIALMKSDLIKGIKGGGYMPEHNFSLNDLDDNQREDLLDVKPELGSLQDLYDATGLSNRTISRFEYEMGDIGVQWKGYDDDDTERVVIAEFKSFGEFIDRIDDLGSYLFDVITGHQSVLDELEEAITVDDFMIEQLIDSLRTPEYAKLMRNLGMMNISHNDPGYRRNLKVAVEEFKHDRKLMDVLDEMLSDVTTKSKGSEQVQHDVAIELLKQYLEVGFYSINTPVYYELDKNDLENTNVVLKARTEDVVETINYIKQYIHVGDYDDGYFEYSEVAHSLNRDGDYESWFRSHDSYDDYLSERRAEDDLPNDKTELIEKLKSGIIAEMADAETQNKFDIRPFTTQFAKMAGL